MSDKIWYNGKIIYDDYGIGERNKSVLEDRFKNRILGPYAGTLYDYFHKDLLSRWQLNTVKSVKNGVINRLENCYGLAIMLRDLRKNEIKWAGTNIHSRDISRKLEIEIEYMLYDELEEPWDKMMMLRKDESKQISMDLWHKWAIDLSILPQKDTIVRDDDDNIPDDELDEVISTIEYCLNDAKKFVVITENQIIDDILKKAFELGVEKCNASYRELYECLDFFDLIPKEQKEYHHNTSSKYVRENFIKAKVKRFNG